MDDIQNLTAKNIWFTSIFYIAPAALTFVFWFVAAKIVGPESIGIASSLVALTAIISTIDILGASTGMKQYLGRAIFSGQLGRFKQILSATILIVVATLLITVVLFWLPGMHFNNLLGVDEEYLYFLMLMVIAQCFQIILSESLISSLESKKLVAPQIIGAVARFPLFFIIVYALGYDDWGTIIAYASLSFVSAILYGIYILRIISGTREKALANFLTDAKIVLKAGLSSWIPGMLKVLGYQLGVLTVFFSMGAIEGGRMYLTLTIFLLSQFLVQSTNLVIHPIIGNIVDQRKRIIYFKNIMNLVFIITLPVASILIFFGENILVILGEQYAPASTALSIIMLSAPFSIIAEMIFFYFYGLGNHRTVLYLGLVGNIPRMILYVLLSGTFGASGAAFAYLFGSLCQFVLAVKLAKKEKMELEFGSYVKTTLISVALVGLFWFLGIHFAFVILLTGALCLYLDIKLKILTESMVQTLIFTIFSPKKAEKINPQVLKIIRKF